jgi:monoamine oxidase
VTETLDTIVIGAGFAGISAARDLSERGHAVTILEAGDHLGGRVYGTPFPGVEHVHADLGGAWINTELQPLIRGEIARYGVPLKQDKPTESTAFHIGGITRSLPVPPEQLGDLDRVLTHLNNASRRIAPSHPLTKQSLRDLDVSADDFFAPLNLPAETREFVYSFLTMYTGADLSGCSMLNLIAKTASFGHSAFGFYSALTERFVRGPESLLHAMVVEGRLDLRLNHRVVRVEQAGGTVSAWTGDGNRFDARTCIVAVPTNVMRHIEFEPPLSVEKTRALAENHLGRCYKVVILARNLPRYLFAVGGGPLTTLVVSAEVDEGTYLLIGFGAESIERIDLTDRAQIQKAVQHYYPTAEVIDVVSHDWNDDPLFDGTWRWDRAGEAIDVLTAMNQPEGRIAFAGADIDDSVWRTWMEGALNSGRQAVDAVSATLLRDRA